MALEMINLAYAQGVRDIVCTSHDSACIPAYRNNMALLQECLDASGIDVTLHPGYEILCDSPNGAEANMVIYTMLEMAKAYDLKIYDYLKFFPQTRPSDITSDDELEALALWISQD